MPARRGLDRLFTEPPTPAPRPLAVDTGFAEFWDAYPRKVGKGPARGAWRAARLSGGTAEHLIAAALRFRRECAARDRPVEYIPYPAKWLRDARWDDHPEQPRPARPAAVLHDEQIIAIVVRLGELLTGTVTSEPLVPVSPQRARELAAMPYPEYLQSPEWQQRRRIITDRAGHRCMVCNSDRPLQVHHRTYERRGNEHTADLIALCDHCHALYHGKGLAGPRTLEPPSGDGEHDAELGEYPA